ncbi:hypothetical protein [Propionicicella superfundia]|uniref:hypothetical protein n=1 Tax=Propionicicella superfundia TaxID=348582 RepID=UPI00040528CC|nr:hypothetical protein [Propionicicella superfundia]
MKATHFIGALASTLLAVAIDKLFGSAAAAGKCVRITFPHPVITNLVTMALFMRYTTVTCR